MDAVHNPNHYNRGGMECKDVMRAMMDGVSLTPVQGYWYGCALKYLWRWMEKNGIEDLEKARECIAVLIDETKKRREKVEKDSNREWWKFPEFPRTVEMEFTLENGANISGLFGIVRDTAKDDPMDDDLK